jgi:hypothetical protein
MKKPAIKTFERFSLCLTGKEQFTFRSPGGEQFYQVLANSEWTAQPFRYVLHHQNLTASIQTMHCCSKFEVQLIAGNNVLSSISLLKSEFLRLHSISFLFPSTRIPTQ